MQAERSTAERPGAIRQVANGPLTELPAAAPHVLLVVDGFPRVLGGGERVALRLAALLPRFGFRASILTFSLDPTGELQSANAPCPVYLLPLSRTYDLAALRGAFALRRLIKRERVQIVQTFFESSDLWAGLVARALSPAKLIWSRRDMGILRGSKHVAAYRALRRLPHAVFAVSEQVRRHVLETDGVDPSRVHTVYNGLEIEPAPSGAARTSRTALTHVLTVGNLRPVKGQDLLIRAARTVATQYPEVVFSFAGEVLDETYFADLQSLVEELGLEQNVRFLGKITGLAPYLRQADIFVLPSRSEGFSNALIEAMAAALPVVATAVGGNAEAIEDGVSGLIVPPEDPSALAEALLKLLAAPGRALQMGQQAHLAASTRFTAEAMMRKTVRVYHQLLR